MRTGHSRSDFLAVPTTVNIGTKLIAREETDQSMKRPPCVSRVAEAILLSIEARVSSVHHPQHGARSMQGGALNSRITCSRVCGAASPKPVHLAPWLPICLGCVRNRSTS